MLAVTMTTNATIGRLLVPVLSLGVAACGGAATNAHSGYPEGESAPWEKATKLSLNDNLEATAEGEISYPKRVRAKWYVVELPAPGKLTARLSTETTVKGTDVALEILDAGFNVVAEGQSDDDVGQSKKTREAKDARQGKSYIHLYALGRNDQAGYTVRLKLDPKPQARAEAPAPSEPVADRTQFPWTVPNLPALPQVKGGGGGSASPPPPVAPPPPTEPPPPAGKTVRASIVEFGDSGSGVRIIVNKGQNAGLDNGMEGDVVSGGKALPTGHFKLRNCKADECEAVVPKATMDQIQANRAVVITIKAQ
jgi:hypothetical protein